MLRAIMLWLHGEKSSNSFAAIKKRGEDERSAIAAAVCAGMKDGSFYRNPKGTVAAARQK